MRKAFDDPMLNGKIMIAVNNAFGPISVVQVAEAVQASPNDRQVIWKRLLYFSRRGYITKVGFGMYMTKEGKRT